MSITRVERPHHTPVHRRDDHPARDHRWISRADRAARATGRAARASAGSPASNPRRRSNAQTADTGNILGRSRARSPGAVATARSTSGGFEEAAVRADREQRRAVGRDRAAAPHPPGDPPPGFGTSILEITRETTTTNPAKHDPPLDSPVLHSPSPRSQIKFASELMAKSGVVYGLWTAYKDRDGKVKTSSWGSNRGREGTVRQERHRGRPLAHQGDALPRRGRSPAGWGRRVRAGERCSGAVRPIAPREDV